MVFKHPTLLYPDNYDIKIFDWKPIIAPGTSISFKIKDGIHPWDNRG